MKLRASIQVTINVTENDTPTESQERVVEKLVDICDAWLNGEATPTIRLEYTLDDDYLKIDKRHLN